MAKTKSLKTLDNETFEWIEKQKTVDVYNYKEAARRRQRYFHIRNVARKEIADLVKLAKTLPEDQFKQIFNIDRILPHPNPDPEFKEGETDKEYAERVKRARAELEERTKPCDDFAELVYVLLRYPVFAEAEPDMNRAEIAREFIERGFEYLSEKAPDLMTISHQQAKDAAVDLANFLTESLKPKAERRYFRPGHPAGYGY